jgi:ADP-ribose pyrophosphatase YjhB (NUDIX family)
MRREYPSRPIVAVGTIIRQDDRIALIRRDKEPSQGRWTFPGGAVELGETVREAAQREALEETGLHVEVGEVAAVVDNVVFDEAGRIRFHYVIIDFLTRPVGGSLQPGTDVSDVCWANRADLDVLDMTEKAHKLAVQLLSSP